MYKDTNKQIRLPVKNNCCFTCVFFIHVPCFFMCILFYFSFIWLHVYAFVINSMVHCGSAFEPGASRLPYYCTPPVCVLWIAHYAHCHTHLVSVNISFCQIVTQRRMQPPQNMIARICSHACRTTPPLCSVWISHSRARGGGTVFRAKIRVV